MTSQEEILLEPLVLPQNCKSDLLAPASLLNYSLIDVNLYIVKYIC